MIGTKQITSIHVRLNNYQIQHRQNRRLVRCSWFRILCTIFVLVLIGSNKNVAAQSDGCRMEIWVFDTIDQCEASEAPNTKGFIYADGQCRTVETSASSGSHNYILLPGTYTAVCTSDGKKIRFEESGCINSDCSSLTVGGDVCQRDFDLESSLYSRLSPPEFKVQDPNNVNVQGFFSCSRVVGTGITVTFTIFGDCSKCQVGGTDDGGNTNDDGGNPSPEPTKQPVRSPPTPDPTSEVFDPTDSPVPDPTPPPVDPPTPEPVSAPKPRPSGKPTHRPRSVPQPSPAQQPQRTDEPSVDPTSERSVPVAEPTNPPVEKPVETETPILSTIEPTVSPTGPVRVSSVPASMVLSTMNDVMTDDTAFIWQEVTANQMATSAEKEGYKIGLITASNISQLLFDTSSGEIIFLADPILSLPPRRLQDRPDSGNSLRINFVISIVIPESTPEYVTAERVFREAFDVENERVQYLLKLVKTNIEEFANLIEVQIVAFGPDDTVPTSAPYTLPQITSAPSSYSAVSPIEGNSQNSSSNNGAGLIIGAALGAIVVLIVCAFLLFRHRRNDSMANKLDPLSNKRDDKSSPTARGSSPEQRWTNEILIDPQYDDVSTLGGSILAGLHLVEGGPEVGEDEPTASVNVDYDFAKNQYRTGGQDEERTVDDVRSRSASERSSSNPTTMSANNNAKYGGMLSVGAPSILGDDDVSFERQYAGSDDDENDENSANNYKTNGKNIEQNGMAATATYTNTRVNPNYNDSKSALGSSVLPSSTQVMLSKPFEVRAPPGVLGMVIDTPGGVPLVRAIKSTSVLSGRVQIGDRLLSVDDDDVRNMTAVQVSSLISQKANYNRKLVFVRPRVPGGTVPESGVFYNNINS